MNDPAKQNISVQEHIFSTYLDLRFGMALLAFIFPILLFSIGKAIYNLDWQKSMSAYYFASPVENCTQFPVRTWFVGFLFAIGTCLYLYKGFSKAENNALNIAGMLAWIVAIFPESVKPNDPRLANLPEKCQSLVDFIVSRQNQLPIHGAAAGLLFICLAYVAIRCSTTSLEYLPAEARDKASYFCAMYKLIGSFMLASPAVAFILNVPLAERETSHYVFIFEAIAVWSFAAYWFVKSQEMKISNAERRALGFHH